MHRTMLMVLYATGMRRTEFSLLKVADIDTQHMVIHIRQHKGPKTAHFLRIQMPHVTGPASLSVIGRPATLRASFI